MAFLTKVKWFDVSPEQRAVSDAKIAEMVAAGVTDGVRADDTENDVVVRTWTTEAAAQEWIAFINSIDTKKESVSEIVEE